MEIARFAYPAEAATLIALLRSEGIECYLRNELTTQIMAGYADVGGARVEILESDVPRALEVMRAGGYDALTVSENSLLAGAASTVSEVLEGRRPATGWTPELSEL